MNISASTKIRCGSKLYNGIEIPANAKIFISPKGRDCYISSILEKEMYIRYVDELIPAIQTVPYNKKLTGKYFYVYTYLRQKRRMKPKAVLLSKM